METRRIALVKGDGAAPEMMEVACLIAAYASLKYDSIYLDFILTPMGWDACEKYGDTLPESSLKTATEIGVLFFGGVGDPKLDDTIGKQFPDMRPEARCLLRIRKKWGLLLNFRPMIYRKELAHLAMVKEETIPEGGVEQHFIRFLLEDSYFGNYDLACEVASEDSARIGLMYKKDVSGKEQMVSELAYYRKATIEKYMRVAFQYAKDRSLPLISIDKANVMARYKFWRDIVTRIGEEEFPDVELKHQLVDSANALLFTPAQLHGVIACGNEHGDILSDGAAAAMGSMGLMCSSAINPDNNMAMFESGSGTAPTLRGQDKANPIGRILTGAMMLRHIGAKKGADAIEMSVRKVLSAGWRTGDIAKKNDSKGKILGTRAMGDKILENL